MKRGLITGASSGLGYFLAKELDQRGYELILIARNEEKLKEISSQLKPYSKIIVGDLTNDKFLKELCYFIENENIDILINNAGIGAYGYFSDIDYEKEKELFLLNALAPNLLMKAYIKRNKKGRIVNISSIAGFQTDPLMAGYGASKTYLTMLSKSIQVELQKQNSKVLIQVCFPGSFLSNFDNNAQVLHSLPGQSAELLAKEIVKEIFKNKKRIIPGLKNKWAYRLGKWIPETIMNQIEFYIQSKKS